MIRRGRPTPAPDLDGLGSLGFLSRSAPFAHLRPEGLHWTQRVRVGAAAIGGCCSPFCDLVGAVAEPRAPLILYPLMASMPLKHPDCLELPAFPRLTSHSDRKCVNGHGKQNRSRAKETKHVLLPHPFGALHEGRLCFVH